MTKYIVYLTVNKVNDKIYIGVHKTISDKFDGYLGCGVKIKDRSSYHQCKTPFQMAVTKYGVDNFIRYTLDEFDNLEDALELEKLLVDSEFIKRKDTYNIALGGNVPPVISKITYQYSLDGEFIKEWESITEASIQFKCSQSSIGRAIFERTPSCGFLWSLDKFDKIDILNFKINANKTIVYVYNEDGDYIEKLESLSSFCNKYDLKISNASSSLKGKYKILNYYISDIFYEKFPIKITKDFSQKTIYQYDLQGNYIRSFDSQIEASKYLNKTLSISRSIRLGIETGGFQWSFEKVDKMKELISKTKAKKVGKYTIDGDLIEIFNTVREAKKDTSGAPNVLSGNRKTAGGYVWKYIED